MSKEIGEKGVVLMLVAGAISRLAIRLFRLYLRMRGVCGGSGGSGSEQMAAPFLVLALLVLWRSGGAVAAHDALFGEWCGTRGW
jgi:hypothetical protein